MRGSRSGHLVGGSRTALKHRYSGGPVWIPTGILWFIVSSETLRSHLNHFIVCKALSLSTSAEKQRNVTGKTQRELSVNKPFPPLSMRLQFVIL